MSQPNKVAALEALVDHLVDTLQDDCDYDLAEDGEYQTLKQAVEDAQD